MILYFSGTGNSAYVAGRLAEATGDASLNLFERIRTGDVSPLCSERPWVVVAPTYAWQLPRVVRDHLLRSTLTGSRDISFVLTCGDGTGNAGAYLQALCARIGMNCRGVMGIVMPENYVAMFPTPTRAEALAIIDRAEAEIDRAAALLRAEGGFPAQRAGLLSRVLSGPVNRVFYPAFVHARAFRADDRCIACGTCARVCPLQNISPARNGKPVWGKRCTHCMACIGRCPVQAIEYGKKSVGKPKYTCPK